jgi:hypothetical protein
MDHARRVVGGCLVVGWLSVGSGWLTDESGQAASAFLSFFPTVFFFVTMGCPPPPPSLSRLYVLTPPAEVESPPPSRMPGTHGSNTTSRHIYMGTLFG